MNTKLSKFELSGKRSLTMGKFAFLAGVSSLALSGFLSTSEVQAAECVTVSNSQDVDSIFPNQSELANFQEQKGDLSFVGNPLFDAQKLESVSDRLPAEPLVIFPYDNCGKFGGTLRGLSNATEAGTSDLLSVRHVNFVRYADDLLTTAPNVAKSWEWNNDFTVLTFKLRKGHKWSDGADFTAEDVAFWYNDIVLNTDIFPQTPGRWLFAGKPMKVEARDDVTVVMTFPVPAPGILARFAIDYAQPFQPKHFLKQFHANYNPDADKLAKERGFKGWAELFNNYYGASDWKDIPSPLLKGTDTVVAPTLESHILVAETAEGRKLVANPYFHMVDTAGNQLPYIDKINERYVADKEVRNLKIANGEVDYKSQSLFLEDFSYYKENEGNGEYVVDLSPGFGTMAYYAFNLTHKDEQKRAIMSDKRFSQAMSVALDRDEINDIVYLGQGEPMQQTLFEPLTVDFVSDELTKRFVEFNPEQAKGLLDEIGLVDKDGDGIRDLPSGDHFIIRLTYSNQGAPVRMHELAAGHWADIGVRVDLKEVTSDEYREQGNTNSLDVTTWNGANRVAPVLYQDKDRILPPFGDPFEPVNGFGWAAWKQSNGAEGIEPPADIKKLYELTAVFFQKLPGSDESDTLAKEIIEIHSDNLIKIGVIGNVLAPVVHHNRVKNFRKFTAATYDYYRAYSFGPAQWYIEE